MNEEKEGFKIICNKCGSEDVNMRGVDGNGVYIYCNGCDNDD